MHQLSTKALMVIGALSVALSIPREGTGQTNPIVTRTMSLEEALQKASDGNYSIRQAMIASESSIAEVHRSRSAFLPQLNLSTTAVSTTDPLNAFGFKLKQGGIALADFDPARLNNPDRTDHFSTRIEINQPILVPDGIQQGKAARSRMRAAEIGQQRTRHGVAFQTKQAYFKLLLSGRQLEVLDSALVVARTNREQTFNLYEDGLITRADLLEADVHLLNIEHGRMVAEGELDDASDHLRFLLDIEEDVRIIPTDGLRRMPYPDETVDVDLVNQNRTDMQVLRLQVDAANHMLRASQMSFLPRISAFAGYELNDSSLFGSNATNWGVGVSLQWNLFSGYENVAAVEKARADVNAAELALEEQIQKNQIEIRQTQRLIEQSRQRIEVVTESIKQSAENLRIRTNRYAEGIEKTTDVLNAEIMLAEQRLSHLESVFQYNVALFRLEFLLEESTRDTPSFE